MEDGKMKIYWFNKKCCVPECYNCSTMGSGCVKEYFDLPAEPQARARWLKVILAEDGENLKVCEDHFKEDDIFRDKSNRRKLKLNSTPSMKLPQYVCSNCLGSKHPKSGSNPWEKICECFSSTRQPKESTLTKRTRVKWTPEEKRTLFHAIKRHGDVKIANNNVRINWNKVLSNCRNCGCFGNERELRSAWQYLRLRAMKVSRNEIYGTKLERKISKFLFDKRSKENNSGNNMSKPVDEQNGDSESSNEDSEEAPESKQELQEQIHEDGKENQQSVIAKNPEITDENLVVKEDEVREDTQIPKYNNKENSDDSGKETCSESEDEHYSLEDLEKKLGIKIKPKTEVISLLSSDESDWEC